MMTADLVLIGTIPRKHAIVVAVAALIHIIVGEKIVWEGIVVAEVTMDEFEFGHGHQTNQMTGREAGVGVPIVMVDIQTTMVSDVEAGVSNLLVESVLVTVHLRSPALLRPILRVLPMVQVKQMMLQMTVQLA
jgi:hypothetical protein